MTFAGVTNLTFALLVEKTSGVTWTLRGVGAILYLVVCGSWIGYTAYIWLLQHVPTSKVSTYAYVNPVVAVALGYFLGGEAVGPRTLLGTLLVLVSVVVITTASARRPAKA